MGREAALDYAGRIASDESQFIYGMGAQPALLQNPFVRMFGMFGTWPLWAGEMYFNRMWKGTAKQRFAMGVRTATLMGIFTNMTMQTGYDFMNWMAPSSVLSWTGGPVTDHTVNMWRLLDADINQKRGALETLVKGVGRLVLPGQVFFTYDLPKALDSDDAAEAAMKMFLGREIDDYNFALEYIYDPGNYYDDRKMYNWDR